MNRGARQALMVCCALGLVSPGAAQAEGLLDFFTNAFSGSPAPTRALPQPDESFFGAPELTVRPRPKRHRRALSAGVGGSQRYDAAEIRGVTIYTDKTLARGDAVMTATGLKVFNGTPGAVHSSEDFVAVADTAGLGKGVRTQLIAIDNASRPALAR